MRHSFPFFFRTVTVITFVVLFVAALFFFIVYHFQKPSVNGRFQEESAGRNAVKLCLDTAGLRAGDLIFRKGTSNGSRIITTLYPAPYSHAGLLWRSVRGWQVVHAVEEPEGGYPAGVVCEPLAVFTSSEYAVAVGTARVHCDAATASKAVAEALKMAAGHIPFDTDYNLNDSSRMYCTELIYRAYLKAGVDLLASIRTCKPASLAQYLLPEDLRINARVIRLSHRP